METIINFLYYSVRAGTPLLLGTTGEIMTEKSGSLNLGVEGLMAMGAIGGYVVGCATNNFWLALLGAFFFGLLGSLIFAFVTVTMQANQNVTGLALTTFGVGIYRFWGRSLTKDFPSLDDAPAFKAMVTDSGIPLLRDIPYIGKLLFSYNSFVYIAVIIAVVCWIYIRKSRLGLKLRAVGENPGAADACGIKVDLYKYVNILIGGGICGIGGLYLASVTNSGAWNDNWINGMGWISVALVIFSNWSPVRAVFGAYFFGMLQTLLPQKGNLALAFPTVFGWLNVIPNEFYQMLPFFITAVVIIVAGIRKNKKSAEPSAIGLNYFREER
ncbi:MAG: ABC transporter permease [Ruminiclostridium sp.]|nr:ABC transporter permease [Ruminiclostridium sp.]